MWALWRQSPVSRFSKPSLLRLFLRDNWNELFDWLARADTRTNLAAYDRRTWAAVLEREYEAHEAEEEAAKDRAWEERTDAHLDALKFAEKRGERGVKVNWGSK